MICFFVLNLGYCPQKRLDALCSVPHRLAASSLKTRSATGGCKAFLLNLQSPPLLHWSPVQSGKSPKSRSDHPPGVMQQLSRPPPSGKGQKPLQQGCLTGRATRSRPQKYHTSR